MIDLFPRRRKAAGKVFTLIELVVAIAIVALTLAIAVTTLRGESPAQKMERTVYEISAFCARVRFRSAEEGRDWVLKYNPEGRNFYAVAVDEESEENPDGTAGKKGADDSDAPPLPRLDLKLDKSFTFETEEGAENITQIAKITKAAKATATAVAAARTEVGVNTRVTKLVVTRTLILIGQNLIRFVNLFKGLFSLSVTWV